MLIISTIPVGVHTLSLLAVCRDRPCTSEFIAGSVNSGKPVFRQLQKNPNAPFCSCPADFSQEVSVSGKAVFVDCPALKKRVPDENPLIASLYKPPGNPIFRVFYLNEEEVETFSFTEGAKSFRV